METVEPANSSAKSQAEERDPARWPARPNLVRLIRFLVAIVPIATSVVALRIVTTVLPRPSGLIGTIAWFAGAVVVAFVTLRIMDRGARRFLPLAALFKVSLVFPTARHIDSEWLFGRALPATSRND